MEMQEGMETKRSGLLQSQAKRVKMIFSVMASPNRIDILRILNSKGPLTYSELKSLAGFKSKKETYHGIKPETRRSDPSSFKTTHAMERIFQNRPEVP